MGYAVNVFKPLDDKKQNGGKNIIWQAIERRGYYEKEQYHIYFSHSLFYASFDWLFLFLYYHTGPFFIKAAALYILYYAALCLYIDVKTGNKAYQEGKKE